MIELQAFLLFSVLVESIITNIKWVVEDNFNWVKVGALLLSVLLCVIYQIDLLGQLGFTALVPFVGSVLTGIIISRGSNLVYEIIQNLKTTREKSQI